MSDPIEKLSDLLPLSPDHNAERLAALKQLFPDLFTNEGRLDVDELKKLVDPALVSRPSATISAGMARLAPSAKPLPPVVPHSFTTKTVP